MEKWCEMCCDTHAHLMADENNLLFPWKKQKPTLNAANVYWMYAYSELSKVISTRDFFITLLDCGSLVYACDGSWIKYTTEEEAKNICMKMGKLFLGRGIVHSELVT